MSLVRTTAAVTLFTFACLPAMAAINVSGLGASYDSTHSNVTFRVYSSRATRIEVDLYTAPQGSAEVLTVPLSPNTSTNIFSGSIPVTTLQGAGITGPVYYGYRAWGPNWPYASGWTRGSNIGFLSDVDSQGNRFNPNKLLIDPYAHEISQDPLNATWNDGTIYATGDSYRNLDSGNQAPKSIVWIPTSQSFGTKPTRAQKDDVIYEVNVRGLTENDTSIPAAVRGTYAGAAMKASYLANLGVTAVELEPVQETQNDANDDTPNSTSAARIIGAIAPLTISLRIGGMRRTERQADRQANSRRWWRPSTTWGSRFISTLFTTTQPRAEHGLLTTFPLPSTPSCRGVVWIIPPITS